MSKDGKVGSENGQVAQVLNSGGVCYQRQVPVVSQGGGGGIASLGVLAISVSRHKILGSRTSIKNFSQSEGLRSSQRGILSIIYCS